MMTNDKKVEEFESKYKDTLFGRIYKISSEISIIIKQIQKSNNYIDSNAIYYNIGFECINKIIELSRQFEHSGISMFSKSGKVNGVPNSDFVTTSFIGKAIIDDLIYHVSEATQSLDNYNQTMIKLNEKKENESHSLKKVNAIEKFFAKIKSFFNPVIAKEPPIYTKEELELANSFLLDYQKICNDLRGYTLNDNVVPCLTKYIRAMGYGAESIPELLEVSVNPDLEKLKLSYLIPELKSALIEEYKKDLQYCSDIPPKDYMYQYVPDFEKTNCSPPEGLVYYPYAKSSKEPHRRKRTPTKNSSKNTLSNNSLDERD